MGNTNFEIEIEIFEGNHCDYHNLGQKFRYPEDIGQISPWLLDSINSMVENSSSPVQWNHAVEISKYQIREEHRTRKHHNRDRKMSRPY